MKIHPPGRRPGLVPALALTCFALVSAIGPAQAAGGVVGPPILGIEWNTVPAAPCAGQDVGLMFRTCECPVDLVGAAHDSTGRLVVHLRVQPNVVCITCRPDSAVVPLGRLAAGSFTQVVSFEIEYLEAPPDSAWPKSPAEGRVEFSVGPECPTPGGVPYLQQVVIGRGAPCPTCPQVACPRDSIEVQLFGAFPDNCTALAGVSFLPDMTAGPLPGPATVRLQYEEATCLERPCVLGPFPWQAHIRLPALPALPDRVLALPVEAWLRDACVPSDSLGRLLGRAGFPFVVSESCSTQVPPAERCFNLAWRGPGSPQCLDTYSATKNAILTLVMGSTAPITGVQGVLALDAPNVLVKAVESRVPGWSLFWSRLADGRIRFVTFAGPDGEPMPSDSQGRPSALLRATVVAGPGPDVPPHAALTVSELVVSDPLGQGIPSCPVRVAVYPPPNVALLCRASACDANRDGRSDVRDLVLLLNCLNPPPNVRLACIDPAGGLFDCDGDSDFDLEDVFCCARGILGAPGDGAPPPDSARRDAPEIAVRFGLPRPIGGDELEVPLRLEGMAEVVVARVDLTYPDARYEVVDVAFTGVPTSWWTLHEEGPGRIALAVLDLGGPDGGPPQSAFTEAVIRLRLRAGASHGGAIGLAGHEFAAANGQLLETPNAQGRLDLGSIGRVALSAAQPNPFGTTTTFTLTLPQGGAVDAAVFNSAGRRVATLMHEGSAPAGVYTLRWDGVDQAGVRAAGGVYFVRVAGAQGATTRKVLFLPGAVR